MKKRAVLLVSFVAVTAFGCRKPETSEAAPAASASAAATTSATTPPATAWPSASATAASTREHDSGGRWTIDIPTTYHKTSEGNYEGDGVRITLALIPANTPATQPDVVASLGASSPTSEKKLPRGFWFTLDNAKKEHIFVQQIDSGAEHVRLTVVGPLARKTELEKLIAHLSASLVVPSGASGKEDGTGACTPLPWKVAGHKIDGKNHPTFTGKFGIGDGFNANNVNERPFVLKLDKPACDPEGKPVPEVQVYDIQKTPIITKAWDGKHVQVVGDFDTPTTAHHHRPIMVEADSIAIAP